MRGSTIIVQTQPLTVTLTDMFSDFSFAVFAEGSGAFASGVALDVDLLVLLILHSLH